MTCRLSGKMVLSDDGRAGAKKDLRGECESEAGGSKRTSNRKGVARKRGILTGLRGKVVARARLLVFRVAKVEKIPGRKKGKNLGVPKRGKEKREV